MVRPGQLPEAPRKREPVRFLLTEASHRLALAHPAKGDQLGKLGTAWARLAGLPVIHGQARHADELAEFESREVKLGPHRPHGPGRIAHALRKGRWGGLRDALVLLLEQTNPAQQVVDLPLESSDVAAVPRGGAPRDARLDVDFAPSQTANLIVEQSRNVGHI
jgi:hypothetical protein